MTNLLRYQMLIGGERTDASDGVTLKSINPTTEEPWALVPEATAEDVNRAVEAAHVAFESGPWARMSATERGQHLQRLADCIAPLAEKLARTETTDTGKLLRETSWQASNLAKVYEYYAGLADKVHGEVPPTGSGPTMSMVLREPVGVVAAIVPWNSQLHLAGIRGS
jgi:acyl-CoA reductase-like NAD-dependent aldehyde dehydrogenase